MPFKQSLYRGQGHNLIRLVTLAKINGVADPERTAALLAYLEANQVGFYGARQLRQKVSPQGRLVCVQGSGAVEKHIDLVVCRRFKGQGMRWTRAGANRLFKLRTRELEKAA